MASRKPRLLRCTAIAAAAFFALQYSAFGQDSFQGLGFLPGGTDSIPEALSADGMVVVGVGDSSSSGLEAFRWSSTTGMVGLGFLAGGTVSLATSVDADGSAVVGWGDSSANSQEAFRWTSSAGMMGLGFLPGGTFSLATGINADGSVVVGWGDATASFEEAFRWTTSTGIVDLGTLVAGGRSHATGVSADGSVVVGYGTSPTSFEEAFRWTSTTGMVALGILSGGTTSSATAVSGDGSVVVGNSDTSTSTPEAFRWTSSTGMVGLGVLPGGTFSGANAANANGSVVVGFSDSSSSGEEAFRWRAVDGMQSIRGLLVAAGVDMTGWQLSSALGVSASGNTIVGIGTDPSTATEAWLARFGPEIGLTTPEALQRSVNNLSDAHTGVLAQEHGLAEPLLGDDKPIDNTNVAGVFGYGGSAGGGGYVRLASNSGLALLAGVSYGQESYDRADLDSSIIGALALRYLQPNRSSVRPFAEIGGWISPDADLQFDRTYMNGVGTATGVGNTHGDLSYLFGRAGVVIDFDKHEQVVLSGEIGRERLNTDAYDEALGGNPFNATVAPGTDRLDVAKARLAWSFAIGRSLDATLWGAAVCGFDNESDVIADVQGIGVFKAVPDDHFVWAEYGARLGYAVTDRTTFDVFADGVSGEESRIATRVHGGADLRFQF